MNNNSSGSMKPTTKLQSQTWTPLRKLRETSDPTLICSLKSVPRLAKDETYAKDLLKFWNEEYEKDDKVTIDGANITENNTSHTNCDTGTSTSESTTKTTSISSRRQLDTYGCIFPYEWNDVELSGYLVVPSYLKDCNFEISHKVPVVIMFHTGAGPQDIFNRFQADRMARESIWGDKGCIVFVADVLGDPVGWTWGDRGRYWDARTAVLEVTEKEGARQRFQLQQKLAALMDSILCIDIVDAERIAAIGFCFGGQSILEFGRMRYNGILALITFHGCFDGHELSDDHKQDGDDGNCNGKANDGNTKWNEKTREVLICNAGHDPYVPASDLAGAKKIFQDAGWTTNVLHFEAAKHNFSNPRTQYDDPDAFGFDENASTTSWNATLSLLKRVFQL